MYTTIWLKMTDISRYRYIAINIAHLCLENSCHLLQQVLSCDGFENIFLACLLYLATYQQLVQHEVGFLKVEDDVQFTHLRRHVGEEFLNLGLPFLDAISIECSLSALPNRL